MTSLNAQEIVDTEIAPDFEPSSAETVLRWAFDKFFEIESPVMNAIRCELIAPICGRGNL